MAEDPRYCAIPTGLQIHFPGSSLAENSFEICNALLVGSKYVAGYTLYIMKGQSVHAVSRESEARGCMKGALVVCRAVGHNSLSTSIPTQSVFRMLA